MIRSRYRALNTIMSLASGFTGILDKFPGAVAAYSTRKLKTSYPTTLPADYGGGAAAAYSLRKVKSDYEGSAVKVRRSSDGELQDIGFDSNGNLDTTALLSFVNASGNAYTSDFRVIGDPPVDQEDMGETGGTGAGGQSIADVSDAYKFTQDGSTGIHRAGTPTNTNIVGGNVSVSFDYYLPSGQTSDRILFRTSDAGDTQVDLTTTDDWTTYSTTFIGISGSEFWFYSAIIGQGLSFTGNGSDHFYLKNIVVTQTDADGHVTRWYSQSNPVDTYTADFSGGVDGFSATPNNTATVLSSVTDIHGTTVDNVLELNCDNTTSTIHILRNNNPLPTTGSIANLTLKCSFKMLVPSSNTTLVGAALSDGNQTTAGIVSDGKVTEQDRWITFTDVAWTQANQSRLFFMGLDASDGVTFSATTGDKFYIADVVLTETTDAYNGTGSQQPLIVEGGDVVTKNGKAAIKGDGANDVLNLSTGLNLSSGYSIFQVVQIPSANSYGITISSSDTSNFSRTMMFAGLYRFSTAGTNYDNYSSSGNKGEQYLWSSVVDGSGNLDTNRNGSAYGSTITSVTGTFELDIIGTNIGVNSFEYFQELIVFDSDQSTNRKDIEWNINNHYSIYDQWDRESCMNVRRSSDNVTQDIGFSGKNINQTQLESFVNDASPVLDDYTGDDAAAAAYSLRKIRTAYTGSAINVRRSSDGDTKDIGFDANGDLDTTALLAFVGNKNLFEHSDPATGDTRVMSGTITSSANDWGLGFSNKLIFAATIPSTEVVYDADLEASTEYTLAVRVKFPNGETIDATKFGSGSGKYFYFIAGAGAISSGYSVTELDTNTYLVQVTTTTGSASNSVGVVRTTANDGAAMEMTGFQINEGDTLLSYTATDGGVSGDGAVTTWYDQAGSNNATADCSNPSACEQPLIVEAGDVVLENNKPAIKFDGVDDWLDAGLSSSQFSQVFVVKNTTGTGTSIAYSGAVSLQSSVYNTLNDDITFSSGSGLYTIDNINVKGYLNGVDETGAATTFTQTFNRLYFGSTNGSLAFIDGKIQEYIHFPYASDQSSNRTGIEGNIGRYYNITGYRDGFVTKWYDQSGEYNHAENSTSDEQPQIVSNGSMLKENGKAALDFDGVDDDFTFTDTGTMANGCSSFTVFAADDAAQDSVAFYKVVDTNNTLSVGLRLNVVGARFRLAGSETNKGGTSSTDQVLLSQTSTTSPFMTAYLDGAEVTSAASIRLSGVGSSIGSRRGVDYHFDGTIQEIIFFESDESTNREDIEKNINTHFKIYS